MTGAGGCARCLVAGAAVAAAAVTGADCRARRFAVAVAVAPFGDVLRPFVAVVTGAGGCARRFAGAAAAAAVAGAGCRAGLFAAGDG